MAELESETVRLAYDKAWADHQHTRDQTWKSLQIEAVLAAGLVGIDWQVENIFATLGVAILVVFASWFGSQITVHHRNEVEIKKFKFIRKFEDELHLTPLLGKEVEPPEEITFWDAFKLRKHNTSLFILRMHVVIMIFAVVYMLARLVKAGYMSWLPFT